jgi:LuxR family maltose regulon positive regulatory protein
MNSMAEASFRLQAFPACITMPKFRADTIDRPALDAELASALMRARLVLVCAPAGYGKTIALVHALSRPAPGRAHAWVSVSDEDDLSSLLACLLMALDPLDLPWRHSSDDWPSQVLTDEGMALVASSLQQVLEHADCEHGVIVLDDLHRLSDVRAHAFLNLLVERLPARWTLAIASRQRPPLALARLRLHGELAEFGQAQLRFGRPELRALLRRHGREADDAGAERLFRVTQGWPVGAATLGHAAKFPDALPAARDRRRRLFDYLATEVLDQLSTPMRKFLLRCSVLRELSVERCMQVADDRRARIWLEELERRDLFVSVLDADRLTLRLNDLFREFLEARLLIEHPDEHRALLLRVADGEPDIVRRVGLCLRAGAVQQALQDVMDHAIDIVLSGGDAHLHRVLEQFPAELRDGAPELAFMRGLWAWNRYRWQTMLQTMLSATEGFERQDRPEMSLQARAFAVLALNYLGRVDDARRLWEATPRHAEGERARLPCLLADYMSALMNGPASATPMLAWRVVEAMSTPQGSKWVCFQAAFTVLGRWGMRAPTQALARALNDAAGDDQPRLKTTAMLLQARLALWRADFASLHVLRERLQRESAWLGEPPSLSAPLQYMQAYEKHVTGDADEARRLMRALSDGAQGDPERRSSVLYRHVEALFASANGQWDDVQALRDRLDLREPCWPYLPIALAVLDAEVALHQGQAAAAADLLRPLLQRVADVDALATHTRLRVALARAECALGEPDRAWRVLAPALEEVCRSGEILGLLILGPRALDELTLACWPAGADPMLRGTLLDAAHLANRLRSTVRESSPTRAPIEVLSERERQVLALMAAGHSNKTIARELGLSPHTVKRHVARILERTGHASRMAAAHWFLEQGARESA